MVIAYIAVRNWRETSLMYSSVLLALMDRCKADVL